MAAGPAAAAAAGRAEELRRGLDVPVESSDERYSTVIARQALAAGGRRPAARRAVVDKMAAAAILQTWLDRQRAWPGPEGPGARTRRQCQAGSGADFGPDGPRGRRPRRPPPLGADQVQETPARDDKTGTSRLDEAAPVRGRPDGDGAGEPRLPRPRVRRGGCLRRGRHDGADRPRTARHERYRRGSVPRATGAGAPSQGGRPRLRRRDGAGRPSRPLLSHFGRSSWWGSWGFIHVSNEINPSGGPGRTVTVTCRRGPPVSGSPTSWRKRRHPRPDVFEVYLKLEAGGPLLAGTYQLATNEDYSTAVARLEKGPSVTDKLVVPEGFTIRQMAAAVAKLHVGISAPAFLCRHQWAGPLPLRTGSDQ